MENIIKKSVENKDLNTPEIDFNAETGNCYFTGTSFMESPEEFYKPLTNWIYEFIRENNFVNVIFEISYYNSGSSKSIYDFLSKLKIKQTNGANISVKWIVEDWDIDIKDDVKGLIIDTGLNIEIINV